MDGLKRKMYAKTSRLHGVYVKVYIIYSEALIITLIKLLVNLVF